MSGIQIFKRKEKNQAWIQKGACPLKFKHRSFDLPDYYSNGIIPQTCFRVEGSLLTLLYYTNVYIC